MFGWLVGWLVGCALQRSVYDHINKELVNHKALPKDVLVPLLEHVLTDKCAGEMKARGLTAVQVCRDILRLVFTHFFCCLFSCY